MEYPAKRQRMGRRNQRKFAGKRGNAAKGKRKRKGKNERFK
jgi:hypothetical protein